MAERDKPFYYYYDDDYDLSFDDSMSFDQVLVDTVFNSPFSPDQFKNLISNQFDNYISTDNRINYFQEFLTAYKVSKEIIELEIDEYTDLRTEILNEIYKDFIDFMVQQIQDHFTISIPYYELGMLGSADTDYIIDELYKTFVLDARKNLTKAIVSDLLSQVTHYKNPDDAVPVIKDILNDYANKITSISCEDFLMSIGKDNIVDLYDMGTIAGNFFRKFSPHFDSNEDLKIEILNQAIIVIYFKNDEMRKFLERTNTTK